MHCQIFWRRCFLLTFSMLLFVSIACVVVTPKRPLCLYEFDTNVFIPFRIETVHFVFHHKCTNVYIIMSKKIMFFEKFRKCIFPPKMVESKN
jgi:hypothetical protein